MTCRETERLLDTFFDGELDGRLMRDAALHITRCQTCERELQERESLHDLVAETIAGEVAEIAPDEVWVRLQAATASGGVEEASGFRMAAATSAFRGLFVRPRLRDWRQGEASGRRARAGRGRMAASLPLAGLSALAAGLVVMLLATNPDVSVSPAPEARLASSLPATPAAVTRVAGRDRRQLARANERSAPGQVQINSLEYSGKAMALWREPASETTIIWIGDSDPRIAKAVR